MTAIWKTCSEVSRAFTPWASRQKRLFRDRLWTLTEHISAMEHDVNNRKETCQSTGTPLHTIKFGELWSRNGCERWASFCPPAKFSHWETLPTLPHGRNTTGNRQTLARVYVVARVHSLEQQNVGRAQAELCHASSKYFNGILICRRFVNVF